jgi:hypothetical protein
MMAVVAIVSIGLGGLRAYRAAVADVETDAWVGWRMTELETRLGKPEETHTGDFSPDNEPRPAPPGETPKTVYYRTRWGHLYLWLRPESGGWSCYHSLWFRNGTLF